MRETLNDYDGVLPIRIVLPEHLYRSLRRDASFFEAFFHQDDRINLNAFLNNLVCGYYDVFQSETAERLSMIGRCVSKYIQNEKETDQLSRELAAALFHVQEYTGSVRQSVKVTIRPKAEKATVFQEIINRSSNESMANYFRRLFYAYCEKPMYERERIIFSELTEKILKSCEKRSVISFVVRGKPGILHRVVPYKLVPGTDERYNYLLAQEYDENAKKLKASSFRLCRILDPNPCGDSMTLDPQIATYLEKMEKYSPQHEINSNVETCIQFTRAGRDSFRRIYQGRPEVARMEGPDEEENCKYYFECSEDQLFLYFRRFNPGEVEIMHPESLKMRLIDFHERHLENLRKE